jgi:hypothetical protein
MDIKSPFYTQLEEIVVRGATDMLVAAIEQADMDGGNLP